MDFEAIRSQIEELVATSVEFGARSKEAAETGGDRTLVDIEPLQTAFQDVMLTIRTEYLCSLGDEHDTGGRIN